MSETKNLPAILEASGLEGDKREALRLKFAEIEEKAKDWDARAHAIIVTDVDQTEDMQTAREQRLELRAKRIEIEKTRKAMKQSALNEGRAIDSIAKYLTELITPTESYLADQEHYAENKQKEEEEARRARAEALLAEQERIEAEDQERKAAEERERVAKENERLKAEAEEREKDLAAERKRIAKEIAAAEAANKAERDAREQEIAEERAEQERKREAERAAHEAEREAERKAHEAELARVQHTTSCPKCGHEFDTREVTN